MPKLFEKENMIMKNITFEKIKKSSRYGKIIISTDAD